MGRYFIIVLFLVFFSLVQNASAGFSSSFGQHDCDPTPKVICDQCAPDCDIQSGPLVTIPPYNVVDCKQSYCSLNEVAVGCKVGSSAGTEDVFCEPLNCGSCGVPRLDVSGNKNCFQSSDCDSSCVEVVSNTYGYSDTTDMLGCNCNFGYGSTSDEQPPNSGRSIREYIKKADGTACTLDNGRKSNCKNGICVALTCEACPDGTPCDVPTCSRVNIGKQCVDQGGFGRLVDSPSCREKRCAKYSVISDSKTEGLTTHKAGPDVLSSSEYAAHVYTGTAADTNIPEICFDSYSDAAKTYTNWLADAYGGTGSVIAETYCTEQGKCAYEYTACGYESRYYYISGSPTLADKNTILSALKTAYPNFLTLAALGSIFYKTAGDVSTLATSAKPLTSDQMVAYCQDIMVQNPNKVATDASATDTCNGQPSCNYNGKTMCIGECIPGEAPKKATGVDGGPCTPVNDCKTCGCASSEYPGCNAQCYGSNCAYDAPPPCVPNLEVADCPILAPESDYNITYNIPYRYLVSGASDGKFYGFNYTGTAWQADNSVTLGLTNMGGYSTPAVFDDSGNNFIVSGKADGTFSGFKWSGASWVSDSTAAPSGDIGARSNPAVFYMDGKWNMIAGKANGGFSGFSFNMGWVSNTTLEAGLLPVNIPPDTVGNSAPSVFFIKAVPYIVIGSKNGNIFFYNWTGSSWQRDYEIETPFVSPDFGTDASPYAFRWDDVLYLAISNSTGGMAVYNYSDFDGWQPDNAALNFMAPAAPKPALFTLTKEEIKTYKLKTRFPIENADLYKNPDATISSNTVSTCYQNTSTITVPEGHACKVLIYGNTTQGGGVRLYATTSPGKKLHNDPYNYCGFDNPDIYGSCSPTGFSGQPQCPVNFTPILYGGDYEFGIVHSWTVRENTNTKVAKGCGYILQCSDCSK